MSEVDELEQIRLSILNDYQVMDTEPERDFDSITRLASYICKTPISLVSLVDENRQWFKSRVGLEATETPRNISFCRYTIQTDDIFEVEDTAKDARFRDNPLVTGSPDIKFYAGAPLLTPEGYRLGSLCVIDTKPNKLDDEQKDALKILASEVISHLEVAKKNRQLKESLDRYSDIFTMFDSSSELHCILDDRANIEMINKSVTMILGYSVHEAIGRNMAEFVLREDMQRIIGQLERQMRQGDRSFMTETRIRTKDGSIKWIGWSVAVKNRKWFVNGRDITYQKKVLSDLRQLSLVASKVNNGVVISNSENEVIWVNDAFEKITGFTIADLKGNKLGDILRGDNTDEGTIREARERTKNKQSFNVELLVYRKDGTQIWISVMNSVILKPNGEMDKEIEIITDISARKEAEQQLDILSLAASKSSSGVIVRKDTGEILWMNESLERILGYQLDELKGKTFGEILIGEETDLSVLETARTAVIEKRPYEIEVKIYRKDKTAIWVFISNNPILSEDGTVERQVGIMVDITERKKADEQLNLLSLVASKTGNGVAISNAEGYIEWINDSYERLTGYSINDLRGKLAGDVMGGAETDIAELERARSLARQQKPFMIEILNYKKNGEPAWFSISNTPVLSEDGTLKQQIEIVSDISERKKAEQELIKNREDALQLSKAKETFLSVMSHEIRTPLNAVIGMSHILLDDNPADFQLENLNILKFSAENLLSLLNDILDFTKIETNNLKLESINVNLADLVSHTMNSLQFKATEKSIILKSEIDHRIPKAVKGDNTRLYQILINLLGNSIKFTDKGEVKLKLDVLDQNKSTITVRFEISDTGIGIPADKLDYIFEAYAQANSDTSRKYGGTGLGLAITRKLLELHNSQIKVISEPGKGSSFIFAIQFQRSANITMTSEDGPQYRTFTAKVLVVDDNDINRLLAKKVLARWGITAEFAENGQIAVDLVKENKYDLILMDIQMPVMGGLEAVSHIRNMDGEYFKKVPIIALTASIMSNDLTEIHKSGMNDFVLKPFVPDDLYKKINVFL